MKLSRLKQIIKEEVKKLGENRSGMGSKHIADLEDLDPTPFNSMGNISDPCATPFGDVSCNNDADCEEPTPVCRSFGECKYCDSTVKTTPKSKYRAPSGFTMGENITACVPVNKECNSQAQCVDADGNRCGDCINIGAPHHESPGICTTKSYDKFAPRDNQMDRYKR